jgi:hypothetical protein
MRREMMRKMGYAVAAIGVVLVVLLALGAGALWLSRYSYAKRARDLSPNCEIAALDAFANGDVRDVRLPQGAPINWDAVRIYPPYSRLDDVRAAGINYNPAFDHVPEVGTVLLFVHDGSTQCAQFVKHESGHHLEERAVAFDEALHLVLRKD